jgi:glycerol-3-phosphate O-acyltransferase
VLASLLASVLEGYRVVARSLEHLEKSQLGEKELVKKALSVGREMLATGVIERPEAVSKPMIQNALQAFVDHGFLLHREGYELSPAHTRPESLAAIEQTIASYLPRGRDA